MELELGRAYVLRPGDDVTIVACGVEIREALAAAELLAEQGVSAEVVDAFSVKPARRGDDPRLGAQDGARRRGRGAQRRGRPGLGGGRRAWLGRHPAPCAFVGVQDVFGKSGEFEQLLGYFHLDAAAIVEAVKNVMAR